MRDKLPWMLVSALAGALAVVVAAGPTVRAEDKAPTAAPAPCPRWEVGLFTEEIDLRGKPPAAGQPIITKGPTGAWEPFAFGPGGQLVYRRCVK